MNKYYIMKYCLSVSAAGLIAVFTPTCKSTENAMDTAGDSSNTILQKMKITRSGSQSSSIGSAEYFTGKVKVDPLFQPNETSLTAGAYVTFSPGARSAWHTHPMGQILIVTEGAGLVQQWGEPVQEIKKGDVIWTPPNQKHWHGATAKSSMTHIAIQEQLNGKTVNWMEKVSDEDYNFQKGN